jgi:hypothetical protein
MNQVLVPWWKHGIYSMHAEKAAVLVMYAA